MDIIQSIQRYFDRMFSETTGMKCLLLDKETVRFSLSKKPFFKMVADATCQISTISQIIPHSTLLANDVFLTEKLENKRRDRMTHMKCLVFVRPTPESIQLLCEELRSPCYGEYWLCMSTLTL